jgi:UDP-galactose-lipid carrier transferase
MSSMTSTRPGRFERALASRRSQPIASAEQRSDAQPFDPLHHAPQLRGRPPSLRNRVICAAALLIADLVAFSAAMVAAIVVLRLFGAWSALSTFIGRDIALHIALSPYAVLLLGTLLCCAYYGHYWRRLPFWTELRNVLMISMIALLCNGFIAYATHHSTSRLFLLLIWLALPTMMMLARMLARRGLLRFGLWQLPVLLVASGTGAEQASKALLSEPRLGYEIVGIISSTAAEQWRDVRACRRLLRFYHAQLFVLALDTNEQAARSLTDLMLRARVPFAAMPRLEGLPVLCFEQTSFFSHDTVMFVYRNNMARPLVRLLKITFDLFAAIALLVVLGPLMLLIAVAVRRDGGPALFAHMRIGANGREFPCFKFRSMHVNSDSLLRELWLADPSAAAEWDKARKLRNDPRITKIGRLLRSTSLDELPQLLNVLRLEMSLVGPRPIVASEIPLYAESIDYYYEARPGLTGLWQVSGRSDVSYEQRVQLDTWYVKNWTMGHDIAILAKTIPAVLKRRGAV